MKLKLFIFIVCLLCIDICNAANISHDTNSYLRKPSGRYEIGFNDFHWINNNACPDFNFNGKNQVDFNSSNIKHCHEIMVRVYYPTDKQHHAGSSYYPAFIKSIQQEILKRAPDIDKKQIEQLTQIKSYTQKNAPVSLEQFPVLLFSPGFAYPAQAYENSITELVSHGYIVVGINTPFINLVELPNTHVIEATESMTLDELENKLVPLQAQDLLYTFGKLRELHDSNALFSHMDLNHVGLFGHSIGARVLADIAHSHPTYFQAAATLDIGFDETGNSLEKFTMPFLHIIAADRKLSPPGADIPSIVFELAKNNYLVGMAESEQDTEYSSHDNFTDVSTLQYLPAFQTLEKHLKQQFKEGFNFVLTSHEVTKKESERFDKVTYVLIKTDTQWHLVVYEKANKTQGIDVSMVAELPEALEQLPNKPPEQLSNSETEAIKNVIGLLHYILYGKSFLGTGDGLVIANSVNNYLVHFFDTFLKDKESMKFKNCTPLSEHTYIKCGPGQA